jgi:hypothetical protein
VNCKKAAGFNQPLYARAGVSSGDRSAEALNEGGFSIYAAVTEKSIAARLSLIWAAEPRPGSEAWRRANVNDLTDFENRDPVFGVSGVKALLCQIEKDECSVVGNFLDLILLDSRVAE